MMPNLPQSLPTLFPISPWHPCILIGTWAHTSYVFCHAVLAAVLLLLSHLDSALYIYIYIYEWVYCLLLWSYKSPHTNACYCLLFVALLPHIRVSIVTAIISGHLNVFIYGCDWCWFSYSYMDIWVYVATAIVLVRLYMYTYIYIISYCYDWVHHTYIYMHILMPCLLNHMYVVDFSHA